VLCEVTSLFFFFGESGYALFQSGPPAGDIPLRKMIAVYLRESRGVVCSPEQIIIGAGTPVLLKKKKIKNWRACLY
ncbi:hypothetical protein BLX88_26450, partial [Bacillus obstructivus]